VPHPGKYTWLKRDYGDVNETIQSAAKMPVDKPCSLDSRLQQLLSLIFDVDMISKVMAEIGYDGIDW
jgi:hypothetical protein